MSPTCKLAKDVLEHRTDHGEGIAHSSGGSRGIDDERPLTVTRSDSHQPARKPRYGGSMTAIGSDLFRQPIQTCNQHWLSSFRGEVTRRYPRSASGDDKTASMPQRVLQGATHRVDAVGHDNHRFGAKPAVIQASEQ